MPSNSAIAPATAPVKGIENKLRIEFISKHSKKSWLRGRHKSALVQNSPFEFGVKVTNIGNTAFQGGIIEKFDIHHQDVDVHFKSEVTPQIKALNIGESDEFYFDSNTPSYSGPIWVSFDLKPNITNSQVITYQYDQHHETDGVYKTNCWANGYFVLGQLEMLQANTNKYILMLTALTALEAIFGLKEILQTLFGFLGLLFELLANIFKSLT